MSRTTKFVISESRRAYSFTWKKGAGRSDVVTKPRIEGHLQFLANAWGAVFVDVRYLGDGSGSGEGVTGVSGYMLVVGPEVEEARVRDVLFEFADGRDELELYGPWYGGQVAGLFSLW